MSIMTEVLVAKLRQQQPDYSAIASAAVERQNATEFGQFSRGKHLFLVLIPNELDSGSDEAVMFVKHSNKVTQFYYRSRGEFLEVRTSGFYQRGAPESTPQAIFLCSYDGGMNWTVVSKNEFLHFIKPFSTNDDDGNVVIYN